MISKQAFAKKSDLPQVVDLSSFNHFSNEETIRYLTAFVEGLHLGCYQFSKYKSDKNSSKKNPPSNKFEVIITIPTLLKKQCDINHLLKQAQAVKESVFRARDLVNEPPNVLHTESLSKQVREMAHSLKVNCRIFGKAELKKMKMNAILSVNAGSKHEAKMIILDNFRPNNLNTSTFMMVGKGVMFDSGGLSLKSPNAMIGMKMDMAGAATVISAFEALVKTGYSSRVVAIIPITDNMTGSGAMKVNDIIQTYSGKSVEVLNTDAEGRLILCDALNYGVKKYNPDCTVDLATLTGACIVALGQHYGGLFTPSDDLAENLLVSSRQVDEALWRLPIDDIYLKELQSDVADLKNIGSPYGGASTAAKFLEQFIPEEYRGKWAHLDIAPVMESTQSQGHSSKGGSGFGVRLLVDFAYRFMNHKKKKQ
ncbi:probable cytosol aminopeptidase [Ylistrum balloti]|uniref:probable cytosol aminopeptidase n=1 Tax=Ylistrum balloti TaxID=509963 RepID=UPI002905AC0A|nr:probable cytosol aminopeptidase [Ylistrum balloti]